MPNEVHIDEELAKLVKDRVGGSLIAWCRIHPRRHNEYMVAWENDQQAGTHVAILRDRDSDLIWGDYFFSHPAKETTKLDRRKKAIQSLMSRAQKVNGVEVTSRDLHYMGPR